ncbi:PAS domain-containing protein [Pikeienuella piscinae]|uniref:PAS domain-containing protein n=1 Tax=Pikeienuella piscinae TaxID=2748098 RepID=A0A7L5BSF8_9RHOB|nr:PAS domain-containing protein [Pikeienuella piscinae]QIE54130.1 PAS domain-containing protein [Pikeienuella piscinae]
MRYDSFKYGEICIRLGPGPAMNAADMEHAGTRALHAFWTALRGARPAPYLAEVTNAALGRALCERAFVLESLGPGDLRIRRAGSALFELFGMELRGMRPDTLMVAESRASFLTLAEKTLESGEVAVARAVAAPPADAPAAEPIELELILAPLRNDFGRVDRLLGAAHVIGSPDVARTVRRCRLLRTSRIAGDGPPLTRAEPLPGFAEGAAPFHHDRPALKGVAGGGTGNGARRRDHLRIVKD